MSEMNTTGEPRKQTEIGEIPESWEVVQIGEIGRVVTGNTPKTSVPEYYGGPYMFIAPGDISEAQYVTKTNKYVSAEGLKVLRPLPRDAILVVCIGTIGKTAMTSAEQNVTNQQINAIIPNARTFSHYVYYAVTYRSRSLLALAGRTVIPIVKKSSFAKFPIPLPPLPEQRTIAHVLQTIQEAKFTRQRELALERERKAALMDYLFSYGTKGEPRRQTEIGEIPESWEVVRLETVLETTQYGLSAKANLKRQGYPLLRMNNLVAGLVDTSDLKHIQLDKEALEKFRLSKGDVLFNRTNSFELVGKTGLFDKEGDYVFASYLIRLVTDSQVLNSYFLSFYFNWEAIQTRLKRLSFRGAGQSNISASKLKMFKIPLPSSFEQQKIAEVLCAFDTKTAALEQEITRLDELLHAMLNELMIGKRSVLPLIDAELPN